VADPYRFGVIQAVAWKIVAELFRRHAASHDLRLLETHPGASMRGQLSLLTGRPTAGGAEPASIMFNFGGPSCTCDVRAAGSTVVAELDFVSPMLKQDPIETIDRLEGHLGLRRPESLPPSTAGVLAVRTLSAVLSHEWLARTSLRVTSAWVDASVSCAVPKWTRVFSVDLTDLAGQVNRGAVPWQDAHAQTHRFLAIHEALDEGPMLEPDRPFVALDLTDGALVFAGPGLSPRRTDLSVAYQTAGRRLGPIVDAVLAHLGR